MSLFSLYYPTIMHVMKKFLLSLVFVPIFVSSAVFADDYLKEIINKAEHGDMEAQNYLGMMYEHGEDLPQDYTKAVYWYRKAAEQGHAQSQVNLGWMYFEGQGIAQDYKRAAYWYRKAAVQGEPLSQHDLGIMYYKGLGVDQDYTEALMWLNLAVSNQFEDGFYDIYKETQAEIDRLEKEMPMEQVSLALKKAREWQEVNQKNN